MKQPFEMTAFIINGCPVKAKELATELVGENRPYLIFDAFNDMIIGSRLSDYTNSGLWPLVILDTDGGIFESYLTKLLKPKGYSVYSVKVGNASTN